MNELDSLKSLLLKEEQEELKLLNEKLKRVDISMFTPEIIIEKISPHLSAIIKNSSITNKEELEKTLNPIIFGMIDKSYVDSKDKITRQLAPLISSAIKEQIKSQKDEVVEALYPVLGNMISKYVSKTFEEMIFRINNQITNGLSFKSIKRKIKSKIKGVSESQLLLSENATSNIRSVFLIHKETGIVLSHAEHEDNPINEPEMLASMMTAIRSFVNEWIDKNEQYNELGTIEYGGSKILIEASGYSYLAVIVEGSVNVKVNEKIRNVLECIVSSFSDEIKNFNGDLTSISTNLYYEKISILIENKEEQIVEKRKIHLLLYMIPLLFLLWIGWILYLNYKNYVLVESVNNSIYEISDLKIYKLDSSLKKGILNLDGFVRNNEDKLLINEKVSNIKGIEIVSNNMIVLDDQYSIKEKINKALIPFKLNTLLSTLNLKESINIDFQEKNSQIILNGEVWSMKDKEFINNQLKKIENIKFVDNIKIVLPKIMTKIYFGTNSSDISLDQEYKLIEIINLLKKLDPKLTLEIEGYSDSIGTKEYNISLAEKRAKSVMEYLKNKGMILQNMKIKKLSENSLLLYNKRHVLVTLVEGK